MNILLVEPNITLGKIYKKSLETAGHEVAHCRSAQEAVLKADETKPDAVLLELQLPGHSGIEFLYEFRSYADWQDVPVVLHTLVPQEHLYLPQQLGVIKYLYKPVTSLKLLNRELNNLIPAA